MFAAMNEQAAFARRLKEALKREGIEESPTLIGQLLARYDGEPVTSQAISGWLSGKHLPKQANMRALALMLDMSPYELQYGGKHAGVREPKSAKPVSAVDRLAIDEFLRLSQEQRALVRELIRTLLAQTKRS